MQVRSYYALLGLLTGLTAGIPGAQVIAADASSTSNGSYVVASEEEHHPDAWITTKIKSKLLAEHFLSGLEIKVSTHDGVVQLAGYVKTPDQVSMAVKLASETEGVKQIENDLFIK